MRYFDYLNRAEEQTVFHKPPTPFRRTSARDVLAYAVGAALYSPATRTSIADDILTSKHQGLRSMVLDLEDAIGDHQVELAEQTLVEQISRIASYVERGLLQSRDVPLLFVRVRNPEQLERMILQLGAGTEWITSFFLPKFTPANGQAFFEIIASYNQHKDENQAVLYGSPILESESILFRERRMETLYEIRSLLDRYHEYVLNVRIGATDFSSLFGLRRSVEHTIYDIATIRDCIADILNVFARMEAGYVISGPVWEYFSYGGPCLYPMNDQIVRTARKYGLQPTNQAEYGLIREVLLDKENGIVGKTIIHPSHIQIVQSLSIVTYEEYSDALHILEKNDGLQGIVKSEFANKMNEIKPHLNWARRILAKANIYGVLHEQPQIYSNVSEPDKAYV